MLELRIVEGSIFKKVIEAIKGLINDANFDCSVSGLALNAVDSGLASMVSLLLRAEWFEHYRCDRNVSLGMNLDNMCRMLKCAGNDDIITLQARDDGSDTVAFIFENSSEGKLVNFEINRMEINNEHFEILGEQYHAIVRMPSSEFAKICKDLSSIGDTVVISVTQEGLKFSTRSDIGTANVVCRQTVAVDEPEEATIIEMTQPISLAFSLRYMNSFTKATPLSRTVTISLSSERPLVVEYTIPKMGYIRFNLTSQFEEEDDYQNKF